MGTNFYLKTNTCSHCGRSDAPRHIGKSSAGWCFQLRTYPDEGINDLPDWEPLFRSGRIEDEYGEFCSAEDMLKRITERSHPTPWGDPKKHAGYASEAELHRLNHSTRGPNNLLRSAYEASPGAGPWDLVSREFC